MNCAGLSHGLRNMSPSLTSSINRRFYELSVVLWGKKFLFSRVIKMKFKSNFYSSFYCIEGKNFNFPRKTSRSLWMWDNHDLPMRECLWWKLFWWLLKNKLEPFYINFTTFQVTPEKIQMTCFIIQYSSSSNTWHRNNFLNNFHR